MPEQIAESAYWAAFEEAGGVVWRFDTRIYPRPREKVLRGDGPIGCIIGKNPGSAVPSAISPALQPMQLSGDRFLPTVRSIVRKAFAASGHDWPEDRFVQVLNLFYLCDRDLRRAVTAVQRQKNAAPCGTERRRFPWRWYAWGGPDARLDGFKARYLKRERPGDFFLCSDSARIIDRAPEVSERARHTQGMPHDAVVARLAALVGKSDRPGR